MKKILIIEDDVDVIDVLKLVLVDYETYFIERPHEVLMNLVGIIKDFSPDIIILDLMMPKVDGFQILKILKSEEGIENIPVLIITGYYSPQNIKKATELGVNDFLNKPFDIEELKAKILNFY